MPKKIFIAHGCDPKESGGGYGMDVYLIYANDVEEAIYLCPLPRKEITIEQISRSNVTNCKKICSYYE